MNPTLFCAGWATHLKIVLVSLSAVIVVVAISFNASSRNIEAVSRTVAKPIPTFAGNNGTHFH